MGKHRTTINWDQIRSLNKGGLSVSDIAMSLGWTRQGLAKRCQQDNRCTITEFLHQEESVPSDEVLNGDGSLNWEILTQAVLQGCSDDEIAALTLMSMEELDAACMKKNKLTWEKWYAHHHAKWRFKIRQQQRTLLENGSLAMIKWLGRQELGQTESPQEMNDKQQEFTEIRMVLVNGEDDLKQLRDSNAGN